MKCRLIAKTAAAAALLGLTAAVASAQTVIAPTIRGYYGGGYYGFSDPTFTVTPNGGIQSLGYGYNGFTGSGLPVNPDWEILNSAYMQAYEAAYNAALQASQTDGSEVAYPAGMTATPRGVIGRVPHGSDGVRARRIGSHVVLRWLGDPRVASAVTFSVTDRSGRPMRRTTVSQLPAEVHFTPPAGAVYYQAVVHYVDGATNTIMSRLPR